ncbi:ankyrin-2b isoform X1 [Xyrichtys novacula]|uniref:Ankyrin-2b isoform X1 n=1 Tax=Xyrichtys novacula TaxID=13765 RepID=A0AAV1HL05_XYRNO|nr:ankyrin-2b isoform X1 [Xyrichtys novacula]
MTKTSLELDDPLSDHSIAKPPAEAEVLSSDVVTEKRSDEVFDQGLLMEKIHSPKAKSAKKKKSKNLVKADDDHEQMFTKHLTELSEYTTTTFKDAQESSDPTTLTQKEAQEPLELCDRIVTTYEDTQESSAYRETQESSDLITITHMEAQESLESNGCITTTYKETQNSSTYREAQEISTDRETQESSTYKEAQVFDEDHSPLLSPESLSVDVHPSVSAQHHIPSSLAECSVPGYSLTYDAELWKLISQIRDPQYVGETFLHKTVMLQFTGTRIESNQIEHDVTLGEKEAALQRSLSPDSESEFRPMSPQSLLALHKSRPDSSNSGRSVDSQRALAPDSPTPQFFASISEPSHLYHRSESTVSVWSDLETDLNVLFLCDDRPASPDSVGSGNIYNPLSPDSPIPDFRLFYQEPALSTRLGRTLSFESVTSDIESVSLSSLVFAESRPSSPGSVDEDRPLSPESPIPLFGPALPESSVWTLGNRSSSPISVCSDVEFGMIPFSQQSTEFRPSSPDSAVSGDDYRSDSPIPEFATGLAESVPFSFHRSSSSESVVSDVEYTQSSVDMSICEQRPDSPESQVSEGLLGGGNQTSSLKAIRVPVYRLVYDAELWRLISQIRDPQYVGETFSSKTGVFEYAGTRIEYVHEDSDVKEERLEDSMKVNNAEYQQAMPQKTKEEQTVSMDGERQLESGATFRTKQLICQMYDPQYVGESLEEKSKDTETSKEHVLLDLDAEETSRAMSPDSEAEYRPFSPEDLKVLSLLRSDSIETEDCVYGNRPLCADSPIPQFSVSVPEPVIPYQSTPSPELESDSEPELDQFDVAILTESRVSSPGSEASLSKHRPLSPDSPVPDFRAELQDPVSAVANYRSSSPESVTSDLEDSSVFLSDFDIHNRPASPDSVTSEIVTRPLTPDSETEFRPMSPNSLMVTSKIRASSPDSTTSVNKFRTLSPDSPTPQFEQFMETAWFTSGSRSSSPLLSDAETDELDMESLELQGRRFTPDSETEFRALSPDSPLPDFGQDLLYPTISTAGCISVSPDSVCYSEIDYRDEIFDSVTDDQRPSSPDSVASGVEYRAQPPDSPVPQFVAKVVERFPSFVGFRSSSPISPTSDIEYAPLIGSLLEAEDRPDSPESPEPETEDRPLSPDSESEYRPLSPTLLVLMSNYRSSSPESTGSLNQFRTLSPDSPIPDFRPVPQESTGINMELRSPSPESVSSDLEAECDSWSSMTKGRPSSPGSLASERLSPDSPLPDFRQGLQETCTEFYAYRSYTPDSEVSETEYAPLISQIFDFEERAESPLSGASHTDLRCLSPDSPLPDYSMNLLATVEVKNRSTSPVSEYLDEDLETDLCFPWLFEDRAASPGSAVSDEELRPLSPDSPIPEFNQAQSTIPDFGFRSSSPDSVLSDLDFELELCCQTVTEDRPSSPESTASLNTCRLSPDSPIPDFRQALLEINPQFGAYRPVSPASRAPETEYEPINLLTFDFEERSESCLSWVSDSNLGSLSPDSPLPQYTMTVPTTVLGRYRSTSPASEYVDEDLETDLCFPWFLEDRAESPGSVVSNEELRPLSPDSPIPEFTQPLLRSAISHSDYRSSSPDSVLSDIDVELEFSIPVVLEDRPSSPESLTSLSKYRLSPDSPVPDYSTFDLPAILGLRYRSTSPASEYVDEDLETDLCFPWLFEDRAASPGSAVSNEALRHLSPDSPIPEFTNTLHVSTIAYMHSRSTSPESVLSDLGIDSHFPMILESRPSSPESLASSRLSPDSPIPDFFQTSFEMPPPVFGCRSVSPESACSDEECIVLSLSSLSHDHRVSSPGSGASKDEYRALSPDSPIPDFTPRNVIVNHWFRSLSPESIESDIEYALSELLVSMSYDGDKRPDSPESVASEIQDRPPSAESLPEYKPLSPTALMQLDDIRSTSPESSQSLDEHRMLSPDSPLPWFAQNILQTTTFEMHNACSSPESIISDAEDYLALHGVDVTDLRPLSPQSDRSDDQCKSSESPIPDFTRIFVENVIALRDLSPTEYSDSDDMSQALDPFCPEDRPVSPKSVESDEETLQLVSNLSMNESTVPTLNEANSDSAVSSAAVASSSLEETVIMVAEYNLIYDAELWKLVSKVHDPQYAGETFSSKTGFMQFIGSRIDNVQDDETNIEFKDSSLQDTHATKTSSEVTYLLNKTDTETDEFSSNKQVPESPPPMVEHISSSRGALYRLAEHTFEKPDSGVQTKSGGDLVVVSVSDAFDDVCYSPDSLSEYRPMSPGLVMLSEVRASSPESVTSINELRKLSPDSPLPQFTTLPESVAFLRSTSSSPASLASDIDYMPDVDYNTLGHLESYDRASSPESARSVNEQRQLSPDSPLPQFTTALPECVMYRRSTSSSPASLASDLDYMPDTDHMALGHLEFHDRASSPESITSVNELRQLSLDSPLPQFTTALPECVTFLRSYSSSPATLASDIDYMPDIECTTLENLESHRRASSPESMPEYNEKRSLSPDSPIPQFPVFVGECATTHRSSSPESLDSDSECELMVTSSRVAETDRPSSPESISSINEFRQLLPDSPVPQFMRILSSYFMDATYVDRSSSPVSFSSDCEFVALPIDCWIDDSPRPLSPHSVDSDDEVGFCCETVDKFVSKPELLSHVTPPLLPDQLSSESMAVTPALIESGGTNLKDVDPDLQDMPRSQPEGLLFDEPIHHGLEVESNEKDLPVKVSLIQDVKRKEEKICLTVVGEIKTTADPQRVRLRA